MKPDVSVVIPFTPSATYLERTLLSLNSQIGVQFEVLIVANPKPPAFFSTPAVHYPLTLLQSEAGVNSARNCGLQSAQADLVVFLDEDCQPLSPLFLAEYQRLMNENPSLTGGGGPYSLNPIANIPTRAYHFLQMDWLHQGLMSAQFRAKNLLGGNLIVRKSNLKSENFDPKLKFGGTEREFLFRLYLKGHHFRFWPEQSVVHTSQIYFFQLARKALAQGRGAHYIADKLGDDVSHDLYLKRSKLTPEVRFAYQFYDIFFQIGKGHSIAQLVGSLVKKYFHFLFSILLITKSIQKSNDRSVR